MAHEEHGLEHSPQEAEEAVAAALLNEDELSLAVVCGQTERAAAAAAVRLKADAEAEREGDGGEKAAEAAKAAPLGGLQLWLVLVQHR